MRKQKRVTPLQMALLVLAAVVLLAGGAALALSAWVGVFLRSDEFRQLVEAETGRALRGTATYEPLRWSGSTAYSSGIAVNGTESSALASLRGQEIRARVDWRAALAGVWNVEEIHVVSIDASLRQVPTAPAPVAITRTKPALRGLPTVFSLGALRSETSTLEWLDAAGVGVVRLEGSQLLLEPEGGAWKVSGSRGTLKIAGLPEISGVSFRARSSPGRLYLSEAQGRLEAGGTVTASGQFGAEQDLRVEWTGVNVGSVLSPAWGARLQGTLSGSAIAKWGGGSASTSGDFRLVDGTLQQMPLLDQIATFTASPQFRRVALQEVSGNFTYTAGLWEVTGFVLESKGLLRAEGGFRVGAAGAVEGKMRLGVAPQVLQWLPGSRERVFTFNERGYVWTDVRLGGTLSDLKEDLSVRLVLAVKDEVIERGGRALSDPVGTAEEGVRGVLDVLAPILGR